MTDWTIYLLIGTGSGAVYAAIAMGTILTYKGSGVVNFAQGAMATYPALIYLALRADGELIVPFLPCNRECTLGLGDATVAQFPSRIDLGGPLSFWPAFLIAVLIAAVIGFLIDLLVFRPLASATHVTKVIASVGLNIAIIGLAFTQFGLDTYHADPILPQGTVELWGTPVPFNRFWFVGVVVLIGVALWATFKWSRFGLSTRAAAENQKGAQLMGLSPRFLSSMNWIIASVIAAVAGILAAPVRGVTLFGFGAYVAFGLAAALAARLNSFAIATAVGVGLGMFEALSVHLRASGQVPSWLTGGFDSVVPFVVIVGSLMLFGSTLPTRGVILDDRNPLSPAPRFNPAVLVPALGVAVLVLGFGESGLRLAMIESLVVAVLSLSLVLMAGFVGQVTLAEVTFAGIAAFMLARFADHLGIPFPWSPLLAIAATTVIATLISLPAVRIRGLQFAIVTYAGAIALQQLLFRNPKFTGTGGFAKVPAPGFFGRKFGMDSGAADSYPYKTFGFFVLAVAVGCGLLVANVRRTSTGRRMLAVRANERAAAAAGIHVPRTKLLGAALGGAIAATAGVLWAYKFIQFDASSFPAGAALGIIAFAYIGGIAMVSGAYIAGMLCASGFAFAVLDKLNDSNDANPPWQTLVAGIGMIVVAVKFPGGIASAGPALRATANRVVERARQPAPAPAVGLPVDVRDLRIDEDDMDGDMTLVELGTSRGRPRRRRST